MNEVTEKNTDWIPPKAFFTLRECSNLKGINYRTFTNKVYLQPGQGKIFHRLGGRKVFERDIVIDWLFQDDKAIVGMINA